MAKLTHNTGTTLLILTIQGLNFVPKEVRLTEIPLCRKIWDLCMWIPAENGQALVRRMKVCRTMITENTVHTMIHSFSGDRKEVLGMYHTLFILKINAVPLGLSAIELIDLTKGSEISSIFCDHPLIRFVCPICTHFSSSWYQNLNWNCGR